MKENWFKKTNEEIGEKIGKSTSQVQRYARKMGLPNKPTGGQNKIQFKTITVEELKEQKAKTDESKTQRRNIEKLLSENAKLSRTLEIMSNVKEIHTFKIKKIKETKNEATAVVLASDWHVGETVDPASIGYVNEYNEDIAAQRGREFFQNVLRLINIFEKDIQINKLVLALLGDFISNTIHEDLAETNSMLPADEVAFAQEIIISGIEFLLENTKLEIVIPCHSGNHGRMTVKQRVSSEAGNSLEYYMYKNIAGYFKREPRVQFLIPRGYFSFIEIYDKTVRFHHGHNISYGGGVGGITIPINKAVSQWNKTRNVDIDCFGHFHQFMDGGYWVCNGSMIGFNNYAESIKATFDKPKQAFFLIDSKRDKTIVTPITFDI
ncbi:MAG: hypothetical protein WCX46_03270 [Candidatus Paceibacterota bacterium]